MKASEEREDLYQELLAICRREKQVTDTSAGGSEFTIDVESFLSDLSSVEIGTC